MQLIAEIIILNLTGFAKAKMLRFSYTERLGLYKTSNPNCRSTMKQK